MAIDSIAMGKPLFGDEAFNVVKFALSFLSIFYDIVFLIQHYVLYRKAVETDDEKSEHLKKELKRDEINDSVSKKLSKIS